MSDKSLKIGILGYGSMGRTHAYCIRNIPLFFKNPGFRAELYGVSTAHTDSAEKAASELGIPRVYRTPEELICDPEIDIVDICTPNDSHYDLLSMALEQGKHIYCEKPLCVTPEQSREISLRAAFDKTGLTCGVVFHNRFHLACLKAKEIIDEGKLGRILQFRVDYLHNSCLDPQKPASWKQDRDICGGGVLFDLGSHALDLLTHLAGPVAEIFGRSQIGFPTRTGPDGKPWQTNADEAFYMSCVMASGAMGHVTVSKLSAGTNDDLSFYIGGETGALRWSLSDMDFLDFYSGLPGDTFAGFTRIPCFSRFPEPSGFFPSPKAPAGWLRAHMQSYFTYLSHVACGKAHDPSFEQGSYIQHLMDAAYRSAKTGLPVRTEVTP